MNKKILLLNIPVLALALVSFAAMQAMDPGLQRLRREQHERYLAGQAARQPQGAAAVPEHAEAPAVVAAPVVAPAGVVAGPAVPVEHGVCPICQEEMITEQTRRPGDVVNALTFGCTHSVHHACFINGYLAGALMSCPMCRALIQEDPELL